MLAGVAAAGAAVAGLAAANGVPWLYLLVPESKLTAEAGAAEAGAAVAGVAAAGEYRP